MRRFLTALCVLSAGAGAGAAEFGAGVGVVEITPPKGWRLSGYFTERPNTAVHDPLFARAIVLTQGDERAALVSCDLIGVPSAVSEPARKRAAGMTGIPASNIAVFGTHTHTGPLYYGVLREHFHKRAVAQHGSDPREPIDYAAFLTDRIVDAVTKARAAVRPVLLEAGVRPQTPTLSFNRRYHMKDGTVRFNPGQQNPDIVRPAGPIDPDVGVLLFRRPHGRQPLFSLIVFAMHLDTTGGTEYSADYPYYLGRTLRAALGPEFVSVFGTGTCGNINHIDVRTRERRTAEQLGTLLADTVRQAVPTLGPVSQPRLAARSTKVTVPLQRYDDDRIAQAARDMERVGTGQLPFLKEVEACRITDLQLRKSGTVALEIQAFRLSADVAVVTLPGEIFVELGLAIRKASPFGTTLVIELANDSVNYIPTKEAFAEGGYEAVNSRVQPGAGEQLVEAAVRMLKDLAAAQ